MKRGSNRQAIMQLLEAQSEHLSATDLHYRLVTKGHKLALPTVYSNLRALSEAGLIGEVYSVRGERLFEYRAEPHHHLLCQACGRVQDVEADTLSECTHLLKEQVSTLDWQLPRLQLTLVGYCPKCALASQQPLQTHSEQKGKV